MKSILYSFIVGILVGGVIIYYLLNKATPTLASMVVTSSNNAKITDQDIVVKQKRKIVTAIASFKTDKQGTFTNTITINRQQLQYNHSLGIEGGYFINSQLPFVSVSYSYKNLLVSTKIGYSFKLSTIDYGLGIGGKFNW